MRSDLVEQQERRDPGGRRHQPGVGEDQPDQQRLLLAGRAQGGRHPFWA
jgi:hypothetical protein